MRRTTSAMIAAGMAVAIIAPQPVAFAADGGASAHRAAAYLASRQASNGSIVSGWRPDQVAEAATALAAAGDQPAALQKVMSYLRANAAAGATSGPYTGRIVASIVAAGGNPRAFAGTDFVAKLESYYNAVTGSYGGSNVYADALAMLGVLAAGDTLPDGALTKLRVDQCSNGGWSQRDGCLADPDTDTTALALSVLVAATGTTGADIGRGRAWLLQQQQPTGCWGLQTGNPVNANSCALAIAAIDALRENPSAAPWAAGTRDPIRDLRGMQLDSGAFAYQAETRADDYATVQAVPSLIGWSYPVHAAPSHAVAEAESSGPRGSRPSSAPTTRSHSNSKSAPASTTATGATGAVAATAGPRVLAAETQRTPRPARHSSHPWAYIGVPLLLLVGSVSFSGARRKRASR